MVLVYQCDRCGKTSITPVISMTLQGPSQIPESNKNRHLCVLCFQELEKFLISNKRKVK